jgi:hypothetical protein
MNVQPFSPVFGSTIAIVPTGSNSVATFTASQAIAANCVRIVNKSNVDIAVEFGSSTAVATFPTPGTPGDMVVPAGATEIFSKGSGVTSVALVGSSATGSVYLTPGEGQ